MPRFLLPPLSYSHTPCSLKEWCNIENMARCRWRVGLLAVAALTPYGAVAQSSTSQPADGLTTAAGSRTESIATATIDGTPTTYSVAFTVPASADIGPNILPNIKDPNAKQAQQLCPGYTASKVQRTKYGFSASLSLSGEPVRYVRKAKERI